MENEKELFADAEKYTNMVSPMPDGIRASIQSIGKMQYVHKWMADFAKSEVVKNYHKSNKK